MLVLNKIDLQPTETEHYQDYAQQNKFLYAEISAKQGKKIQMMLRMLRARLSDTQQQDAPDSLKTIRISDTPQFDQI